MNILFDLDGVLTTGWQKAVYDYCTNYQPDYETHAQDFWAKYDYVYSGMFRENMAATDMFYSKEIPPKSLLNAMWELNSRNRIMYATSRPKCVELTTKQWLRRYNFPHYNNVCFGDKVSVAIAFGIDLAIEDSISWGEKLKKVCNVFLINQPYNLDSDLLRINRVEDLVNLI